MWPRCMLFCLFLVAAPLVGSVSAQAQDLTGYKPPDMFGGGASQQVPVPAEAIPAPVVEPAPAEAPVYRASPPPPPKLDTAVVERVNPKPLSDALMGVDNKAPPPEMPSIANQVVPKADMTQTAADALPAPQPQAKVKPKSPPPAAKIVAKPTEKTIEKPKTAPVKSVKLAVKPSRKPPVPSFLREKAPVAEIAATKSDIPPAPAPTKVTEKVEKTEKAANGISTTTTSAPAVKVETVRSETVPGAPPSPVIANPKTIAPAPPINTVDPVAPAAPPASLMAPAKPAPAIAEPAPATSAPVLTPLVAKAEPAPKPPVKKIPDPEPEATLQLLFVPGDAAVSADHASTLQKQVAAKLKADPGMRLQIIAYATAVDDSQSSARRVSLNRALSVRDYLKEAGVAPYRMDIRALGSASSAEHVDRVDLLLIPVL